MAQLKKLAIPKVYIPKGKLCIMGKLKLTDSNVDVETQNLRENYAKTALLMFYPHQKLDNLMIGSSYWKLFIHELQEHRDNRDTSFWSKWFRILQNIEDCMTVDKNSRKATDRVTNNSECITLEGQENSGHCKPKASYDMDDM